MDFKRLRNEGIRNGSSCPMRRDCGFAFNFIEPERTIILKLNDRLIQANAFHKIGMSFNQTFQS